MCAGGRRGVCGCGDSRICFETRSSRTAFHHVESVCEVEGVIGCMRPEALEDAAKRMNPHGQTRFSFDKKDLKEAGCNSDWKCIHRDAIWPFGNGKIFVPSTSSLSWRKATES